jgi:hypothetical protein
MHSALWVIFVGVFVLSFAKTWSPREAINQTAWFSIAYMIALALIYAAEQLGYGWLSTSPTGFGGVAALLVGFAALVVRHRIWTKEKARKAAARAVERKRQAAARATAGKPAEKSLIVDAFRFAGQMQRSRRNAKRGSSSSR